jgi:Zn-dependent peptidase ImmA (M78 family)
MFSAALLMPKHHLAAALPQPPWRGWPPLYRLADEFVVSVTAMSIRLQELGWMHRIEDGVPTSGPRQVSGQGSLFT